MNITLYRGKAMGIQFSPTEVLVEVRDAAVEVLKGAIRRQFKSNGGSITALNFSACPRCITTGVVTVDNQRQPEYCKCQAGKVLLENL